MLTKGLPLRVDGTVGRTGTIAASIRSWRCSTGSWSGCRSAPQGQIANPYFLGSQPVAKAKRFSHREHDIFLVTRLDGFTAADVIAMIDRGVKASTTGQVVLDQKADLPPAPG